MNKYHYRYNYYNSNNYKCNINSIKKNEKIFRFYNEYNKYIKRKKINIFNEKQKLSIKSEPLFNFNKIHIPINTKYKSNSTQTSNKNELNKLVLNKKKDFFSSTINVLDLVFPNFEKESKFDRKLIKDSTEKKKLPLELTDEEKDYEFEILDFKLKNINDLINLGKKYNEYKERKKRFSINIRVLSSLVEPLEQLNNMIGMNKIKNIIFDKIILYLQGLENRNVDYQHIVIYGGPGMGKTEVAKIIGKIYSKLGFLSKGDFKEIKLTDLKAGYVGQSEIKTQKILDSSKGCVLFMDEAYSLGSSDKFDTYSQSIIDIINPYLDKYKDDFILIIAGYKQDLEKRFFRGNQGLKSRFGLWLEIEKYNHENLKDILVKKINNYSWSVKENNINSDFFKDKLKFFPFYGRDIENLFSCCKIAHAKRVLYSDIKEKKIITNEDLINGFELYKQNNMNEVDNNQVNFMYS